LASNILIWLLVTQGGELYLCSLGKAIQKTSPILAVGATYNPGATIKFFDHLRNGTLILVEKDCRYNISAPQNLATLETVLYPLHNIAVISQARLPV
jgi:hypothetical protein